MDAATIATIKALAEKDYDIRKLWGEHLALEGEIERLQARRSHTSEEEVQLKELQKQKLLGKDKLFERMRALGHH